MTSPSEVTGSKLKILLKQRKMQIRKGLLISKKHLKSYKRKRKSIKAIIGPLVMSESN